MCALLTALDAGRACSEACPSRVFVAYLTASGEGWQLSFFVCFFRADIQPVLLKHAMYKTCKILNPKP